MDTRILLTIALTFVMTSHCSALLDACTNDTTCTDDKPNSECNTTSPDIDNKSDGQCVCTSAYTDDGSEGCTAKVLGDSCSANTDCAGVANATCDTNCVCNGRYKVDGATCVDKGLEDSCSTNMDCSAVKYSECSNSTCKCGSKYTKSGSSCSSDSSGSGGWGKS